MASVSLSVHCTNVLESSPCRHLSTDGELTRLQTGQHPRSVPLTTRISGRQVAALPKSTLFGTTFPRQSRSRRGRKGARSTGQVRADASEEKSSVWQAVPLNGSSTADDELVGVLSTSAEVSVFVVLGTQLVREAQRRHRMAPTATAALGRLLLGTVLLGAIKGPEETVQVSFAGRGNLGKMAAIATEGHLVKGFVSNPGCDPPLNAKGKMDVGKAVGPGVLSVVRSHPAWQMPYTGTVPLQTGEVAEDLAHYLAESEQINSAVSLGVSVGRDGVVRAAGGFIVQVLPFCSEETVSQLEANVAAMPPMSDLAMDATAEEVAARLLDGIGFRRTMDPVVPTYGPCSVEYLKPRMLRAVESLGAKDVRELLDEQGHVEVRCEFCSELVHFQEGELQSILAPPPAPSEAS